MLGKGPRAPRHGDRVARVQQSRRGKQKPPAGPSALEARSGTVGAEQGSSDKNNFPKVIINKAWFGEGQVAGAMAKSVGLGPAAGGSWGHREDPGGPPLGAPVPKVREHICDYPGFCGSVAGFSQIPGVGSLCRVPPNQGGCGNAGQPTSLSSL